MGLPFYYVTLALAKGREVLAGATCDPNRQEVFQAERGGGAFQNGAHTGAGARKSSGRPHWEQHGVQRRTEPLPLRDVGRAVWPGMQGIRIMGSSALEVAYAAAGRVDIFVRHSLFPWDIAAGILLVDDAGGEVS